VLHWYRHPNVYGQRCVRHARLHERLKAAAVPEAQAEAQAEASADAVTSELVTRQDLSEAVLKLEARITGSDARIGVPQWMAGFNVVLTVTIPFKLFA
jgi:hypothetical protein